MVYKLDRKKKEFTWGFLLQCYYATNYYRFVTVLRSDLVKITCNISQFILL